MELFDWMFIISSMIFFSSIIGVFILTANNKNDKVKVFGIVLFVLIFPIIAILVNYFIIGSTHIPYIIIEWAACYSFLFGSLTLDLTWGWVVAFFFLAFLIALVYNIVKLKKK